MEDESIIISNIKTLNYEMNNIDNMLETKANLLGDEILILKSILADVTEFYMHILKNLN